MMDIRKKEKWFFSCLLTGLLLVVVTGCGEEEVASVAPQSAGPKKAPATAAQPLAAEGAEESPEDADPEVSLPQYFYTGAAGRDPFVPFFSKKTVIPDTANGTGRKVLSDRPKEPLEQFDLSALRLVAVIGRQGRRMALIRDVTGKSYEVYAGNHIGLNEGKVVRIDTDKLIILEPYVDQFGQQQERLITKAIK